MQAALMERYHWTLNEIGATDIDELFPVMFYVNGRVTKSEPGTRQRKIYADQADWL
ncbi:MAG: hypothetical protein LC130_17015 [Bryobacterales bacterium]|nr:hypothetical protein [Bryobacterales bacterium]MCZ2288582.1 hypothetical protein [Anaerolineales bacterium]